jgi:Type II secretion system (T2SS), protein K
VTLRERIRRRFKASSRRERGVAMLIVLTWLALMISLVGEFTYGTSVDSAQAANARDELRAHYLARSGVNLSRLLIKIQQQFIDPIMGQVQKMLQTAMGSSSNNSGTGATSGTAGNNPASPPSLGFSLRVTDYASTLMGFFAGSKEEVAGLGSLIGLDTSKISGLGLKSGNFDAQITAEDGKIDINCGSGISSDRNKQLIVYRLLMGLMYSPRFDKLFSEADTSGNFATRDNVARAIIDWADGDEQMFTPEGGSSNSEDYRYDAHADHYRAHDNSYDTLEEVKMVRGVSDGFMEAFAPFLTVYASDPNCKVNLGAISNKETGDCTPLVMGVIRAAAMPDPTKPPPDPTVFDDHVLYPLASILCDRASTAGFDSLNTITSLLASPQTAVLPDDPRFRIFQGMRPINIDAGQLGNLAYVGPPRVYRVVATGESGGVKNVRKKITAIVDTGRTLENPLTLNPASEKAAGVLQFWREE